MSRLVLPSRAPDCDVVLAALRLLAQTRPLPRGPNALVLTNVIALAVFWLFPVAPPRLLPGAGYVDVARATGVTATSATSAPNPFAAMPSLHTSWAVWCAILGLLLFRSNWSRVVCCAYPVVTVIVIVTTGNHFVLDAVAGAAVAVFAFAAAAWASGSTLGRIAPAGRADSEERQPDRAGNTFAAQPGPFAFGPPAHPLARDPEGSAGRLVRTGEAREQRRLAGARRPTQCHHLAGVEAE